MAKEETPKDITPIKRRGIDISVNGLKKQYPFIIGYEDDTSDQYNSSHYIDLYVDLDKLSDYMGVPVNPYWVNFSSQPEYRKIYAIWSYLNFPPPYNNTNSNNIQSHPGYILSEELKQTLNDIYSYLPDEYKLQYPSTSGWIDPPPIYDDNLLLKVINICHPVMLITIHNIYVMLFGYIKYTPYPPIIT